jgi:hypothetical protein
MNNTILKASIALALVLAPFQVSVAQAGCDVNPPLIDLQINIDDSGNISSWFVATQDCDTGEVTLSCSKSYGPYSFCEY